MERIDDVSAGAGGSFLLGVTITAIELIGGTLVMAGLAMTIFGAALLRLFR